MRKGWFYIIIDASKPGYFKVGISETKVVDKNGKPINRCRQYVSTYPMGKWKVVVYKEIQISKLRKYEEYAIKFFKGHFNNVSNSTEWFEGSWKLINKFENWMKFQIKIDRAEERKEIAKWKKEEKERERQQAELQKQHDALTDYEKDMNLINWYERKYSREKERAIPLREKWNIQLVVAKRKDKSINKKEVLIKKKSVYSEKTAKQFIKNLKISYEN